MKPKHLYDIIKLGENLNTDDPGALAVQRGN